MRKALILLPLALGLAACGFQPLYGGGARGTVATTLQSVSVAPIAGEAGWLLRGALRDRLALGAQGDGQSRYRIEVRLDDQISGFGLRRDDSTTRERRTLRARWQLIDTSNGTMVIDDTAASDVGIDVVGSEYATIAAEQTALEQLSQKVADLIIVKVAEYARNPAAFPPPRPAAPAPDHGADSTQTAAPPTGG